VHVSARLQPAKFVVLRFELVTRLEEPNLSLFPSERVRSSIGFYEKAKVLGTLAHRTL
jgi:hypothetical protein